MADTKQAQPWMPLASGGPDAVGQGSASRNDLLSRMNMPIGKNIKAKLDDYLNQYVNVPLSESGHPDTGAAISSAVSTAGSLVIPDDVAEAALMYFPAGKLVRMGKGMSKIIPGLEKAGALDYKAINQGEKAVTDLNREKQAVNANTLQWDKQGNVIEKKAPEEMPFNPETNKYE